MALTDRRDKKLKRGLEDLSPLFQKSGTDVPVSTPVFSTASFDVQFLSVCVPDPEADAFLDNAYLASQLVREGELGASLISIKTTDTKPSLERLDSRISRLHLSHEKLWSLTQNGSLEPPREASQAASHSPALIFLELETAQLRSLARATLLLDRVILFVQPHIESLREGYRLIKILWQLNTNLEFFLLFRGPVTPEKRKEFLFERFSLITSRFLGFSPEWLGELGPGGTGFDSGPLLSSDGLHRPLSPEKGRFLQELRKIMDRETGRDA